MAKYQNIYLTTNTAEFATSVDLGQDNDFAGEPDITVTWVTDAAYSSEAINIHQFESVITIGHQCYIESIDRLAFHSNQTKLTSVKRNQLPAGTITIGNKVALIGCAILAYESVTIDDGAIISPRVTIMDSSGHPLIGRRLDDEVSRTTASPVHIKKNAWIGLGATILKGVTVGENAVVGAGSVVYESIPDNAVAIGNPAKIVKNLDPQEVVYEFC